MSLIYLSALKQSNKPNSKIITRAEVIRPFGDIHVSYEVSTQNSYNRAKLEHLGNVLNTLTFDEEQTLHVFCESFDMAMDWVDIVENQLEPTKNVDLWQKVLAGCYSSTKHVPVFVTHGVLSDSAKGALKDYIQKKNEEEIDFGNKNKQNRGHYQSDGRKHA